MGPMIALELKGITKSFGALAANADISLVLHEGEVLALLGENGAGKTTLMNILFGHYLADAGSVSVFGKELPPGSPRAAIAAGVGMVHQHFTLATNLTVLENIMIGTESLAAWRSNRDAARAKLVSIAEKFGLIVDPGARISELSIGERQRVEILKALYRDARILILDEPTAVLTQIEAERLFSILRGMAKEGLSLVFISHKLGEVMQAADRVVVLRGGRAVAERNTAQTDRGELAELMVGRRVSRPVRQASKPGAVVLSAQAIDVAEDGRIRLDGVSFEVRAGEILGIIGVAGNGQAALGNLCTGLTPPSRGRMKLDNKLLENASAKALVTAGVGRIPEDRLSEGVVGEMSVWENAVLERVREPRYSRHGLVDRGAARAYAAELIERFDIRGAAPETRTRLLSGGNMQKLILGRNLAAVPRLLIANQPTRGLDEGAIAAIHQELLEARKNGVGILLISEDLDEVVALADRVQAIYKGRLSPPVATGEIDAKAIGLMMAGMWEE